MKIYKNIILILLGIVFAINFATAQNYKVSNIDAFGIIRNKQGQFIGSVTKKGEILDTSGVKIAFIDGADIFTDSKTGKKLGKVEKNGNYVPFSSKAPDKGWTISAPIKGNCLVKDKEGIIKGEAHENYKLFGAFAIHYMENKIKHNETLYKSTPKTIYVCPMHPELISNIPGMCSKCGMDLKK